MNCQSFENVVNDLARAQMMEAHVREIALAHTGECQTCALRLQEQLMLTDDLRALASEVNREEAPPQIEESLLAAFRQHSLAEHQAGASHSWRYWATAAAAVLLIVVGILALRSRPTPPASAQNPPMPKTEKTAGTIATAKGTDMVEESKAAPLTQQQVKLPSGRRKANFHLPRYRHEARSEDSRGSSSALATAAAATVATNYSESEVATDFLPVGYVNPLNLQDGGQIVRVELPRSALVTFGLPVNMNRTNERVKADVLVGTDGQARAIRFVQ